MTRVSRDIVALATCKKIPEPDVDESLLTKALSDRGIPAEVLAWDGTDVDWSRARAVIVRSTWNYYLARDAFLAWIDRVASDGARVMNAPDVLRYSSDKRYLADLTERGIPTVPTAFVSRGSKDDLACLMDARGWRDVVVKPRVSAGSYETRRFSRDGLSGGELAGVAEARDTMVQPYVASVDAYGERSFVCIDGELTHAVKKSPRFAGGEESVVPVTIAEDERAFAKSVLAKIPFPDLLYARVDVARDEKNAPMVMELELVEPSLFFIHAPHALDRFVNAIARRIS